ncbi:hypothetical protein [Tautonia plasticadhaerens]|uniref:CopG family transcriptional regulator n=1 Tax=Tautonia plasticadhaerens TaxID=2527974 RepID=A0A518GUW1_9BACT|nr:hypothetical protein [Tautonia plasticadhaerens]QDV32375.1 hypothetical protein ElP_02040 [Tautonia plasticadhaerens]
MNQSAAELSVTLSPELFSVLRDEAQMLGLPIEWLIASLVVDTLDEPIPSLDPVAA